MNQTEFVEAVKVAVAVVAKKSVEENLKKPAGKMPAANLLELSDWFKLLNDSDRIMLLRVIQEAIDITIFGFLCVLDGVTAIENGKDKGKLNLYYEKNGKQVLLNNSDENYLHDLI